MPRRQFAVCCVCVACSGSDVMRCANTDRCIHTSYVCDGHDTCGDWTDEVNCSQSTFSRLIHCAMRTVLLTAVFQPRPICRLTTVVVIKPHFCPTLHSVTPAGPDGSILTEGGVMYRTQIVRSCFCCRRRTLTARLSSLTVY